MHHPNLNNSSSRTTTTDEDELDKLLQGLDQLTETLPDLYQQHQQPLPKQVSVSKVLSPQAKTPQQQPQQQQHSNPSRQQIFRKTEIQQAAAAAASRKEITQPHHNNSLNQNKDMEISVQPYHTRTDSKPFSYFRTNNNVSRSTSRASSRGETNGLGGGGGQSGLESPNVLRKIMGNGGESASNSDSRPLSPSVISRGSSPGFISPAADSAANHYSRVQVNKSNSSSLIKEDVAMSDEEASLTWLQKQQRKLEERRSAQRRRELSGGSHFGSNGGHVGGGGGGHEANLMRELKTSLDRARSETTDGYAASETASLLFSDTSTRESSPHKPIHMEMNGGGGHNNGGGFKTSTPKSNTIAGSSGLSLSRNMSDSSYDRSRPLIQRRLRYDSEGEQSNGVASSVDSLASSRPITPGFPNVPQTPVFGQPPPTSNGLSSASSLKRGQQLRAPSPGAGSMYHASQVSHASSRRGSFSSEPADVAPSHVQLAKDHYKYWYKPHISREEAIALLRPRPPGTFVVRDSNSFPGAFGLALKVATPPVNAPPPQAVSTPGADAGDELIRHFLIEPTSKGVKLKGYSNEPVFSSLSALVYQHTVTPLALPSRLILPEMDLTLHNNPERNSTDSRTSMQQLLALGAACNVLYLFTMETDSLTGPNAVKKTISQLMLMRPKPHATSVHFKVSSQGITLTDHGRKLFFRKHYNTSTISFCGIDPEDRRWAMKQQAKHSSEASENGETSQRIFGFVARKSTSRGTNQCHVFAEQDPEQPARAVVNFVNKVLLNSGSSVRADVV